MRKPILFCIALSLSFWAQAQISISVDPGLVVSSGPASSTDIGAYGHITNNSTIAVYLLWTREVVNAPGEWSSYICDRNFCYLPQVGACPQSQPNILDPGQSMDLEFHIKPSNVEGTGTYMIYLYDLSEPDIVLDSIRFEFETSTTGVTEVTANALKIFPNPTSGYFQLNNAPGVAHIALHSLVGNKVREFNAGGTGTRYDVSDLPQGIYLVRLLDSGHNVLKTVRLSKR